MHCDCLTLLGQLVALTRLGIIPSNTHALAAATAYSLHHHGVADLVGQAQTVVHIL